MRAVVLMVLLAACGASDGPTDGEAPASFFTVATTGDLNVSFRVETDGLSAVRAHDGGDACEGSWRGVQITGPEGVTASFRIDGCAVFSEGAPPTSAPAQLEVRSASGERFSSAYFDGELGESVDGCVAAIGVVSRWADSPFHDDHLFLTGTYSCAELYAGLGEGDPIAYPQPGTFTFDWTSSAP
jgi:hypothetical protein